MKQPKTDLSYYRNILSLQMINEAIADWSDETDYVDDYVCICTYLAGKYESSVSNRFFLLLQDMELMTGKIFLAIPYEKPPRVEALKKVKQLLYPEAS